MQLSSWSMMTATAVMVTVTYPRGSAAICVKMFEDKHYRGSSMDACAENAECITLPEHFRDVTSSIGMEGNRCVTLYDRVECEGNSITAGEWETCGPSDLSDKYGQWSLIFRSGCNHPTRGSFNDEARSIRIHH